MKALRLGKRGRLFLMDVNCAVDGWKPLCAVERGRLFHMNRICAVGVRQSCVYGKCWRMRHIDAIHAVDG